MLKRDNFIILTDTITSKKGRIFYKDELFKIDFIGNLLVMMRNKENQFTFDIEKLEGKYIVVNKLK